MRGLGWKLARIAAFAAGAAAGLAVFGHFGVGRRADPGGGLPPGAAAPPAPAGTWDSSLGPAPRFVDVTEKTGISFRHENGMTGKYMYPEVMGAGVGLLDHDGDGLLDIYFVNGNRLDRPSAEITNRLYRNRGDWTFEDVTVRAGVPGSGFGQGCCAGDYDNDGDVDLYVSVFGPNILYRNDGDGTFVDVARAAGVDDPGWGQTCSFLDADGDGWLDLYVQNYLTYSVADHKEAVVYLGARKVLDYATPLDFKGSASRLFRNNRDGTFRDVTSASGILRPDGKGMGCACIDFDEDGRVDIFVANDTMENFYFHNRGNGTFEEMALVAGVAYDGQGTPAANMGVDVGDFDRDGRPDIICPCLRMQGFNLWRNEGGRFSEVSSATAIRPITAGSTGFSPNALDYDDDGDLDLFFSTGGVRASDGVREDAPYVERYGFTPLLLANDGRGRFADASRWAGTFFETRRIGRGSAAGDLDNDGRIDLVVSSLAGRAAVLRNETPSGNWVTFKLVPRSGSRDALGTTVWVEAGGIRQRADVHGGTSYLSQNDRRPHFGLGPATRIDRTEIRWPDRKVQVLEGLPVNRIITVEQGAGAR